MEITTSYMKYKLTYIQVKWGFILISLQKKNTFPVDLLETHLHAFYQWFTCPAIIGMGIKLRQTLLHIITMGFWICRLSYYFVIKSLCEHDIDRTFAAMWWSPFENYNAITHSGHCRFLEWCIMGQICGAKIENAFCHFQQRFMMY